MLFFPRMNHQTMIDERSVNQPDTNEIILGKFSLITLFNNET